MAQNIDNIPAELLAQFDQAHTRLSNLKPGAYRAEQATIVISDGERLIIGHDLGSVVVLGSIDIVDPAALDELASWATFQANRLRGDQTRQQQ